MNCGNCGKLLVRREFTSQKEPLRDFRKRKFCNHACSRLVKRPVPARTETTSFQPILDQLAMSATRKPWAKGFSI